MALSNLILSFLYLSFLFVSFVHSIDKLSNTKDDVIQNQTIIWNNTEIGVAVIDGLLNKTALHNYVIATNMSSHWQYNHEDKFITPTGEPSTAYYGGGFARFVPYVQSGRKHDFLLIIKSIRKFVGNHFKPVLKNLTGFENGSRVAIIRSSIRERLLSYGEFVPMTSACANESSYMAIVNLNTAWGKNDYGDITFYDKNHDIIQSFHPKFSRLYIIECGTKVKINPPSVDSKSNLHLLMFEISILPIDLKKPVTPEVKFHVNDSGNFMDTNYLYDLSFIENLNPIDNVVKNITTSSNQKIIAFENIFPEDYLNLLYNYHYNFPAYQLADIKDSSDNVKWVLGSAETNFSSNSLWRILNKLLIYTAQDDTHVFYDVSCNHIRRADTTTIHKDCEPDDHEYTILIYLNKGMTADSYGETVFLNQNEDEVDFAIVPKFGRVIIFEGNIPHSARPVSPTMDAVRFTYAVKTAYFEKAERKKLMDNLSDNLGTKVKMYIDRINKISQQIELGESNNVPIEDIRFLRDALQSEEKSIE